MAVFTKGLMIAGWGNRTWLEIIMGLDSIIYSFIIFLYKLFLVISRATILTEKDGLQFVRRIYGVIGIVALFMLSYGLLRKVINPDSKDKDSTSKMILNIVKAIVLLAIVPSIFTYAFKIQNAFLDRNTIGKIILGGSGTMSTGGTAAEAIQNGGAELSFGILNSFMFPDEGADVSNVYNSVKGNGNSYEDLLAEAKEDENFSLYKELIDEVDDNKIVYYWGVSTAAGIFTLYILVSYCLALGFRVVKIVFYEIMAPVCIIASILPSQKEMLNRWVKATLQTFLEVFIRIALLYFMIYICALVRNAVSSGALDSALGNNGGMIKGLSVAIITLGVVTFMKSAPDLISKLTGIDSGNMSLGIKDQLQKGGLFAAGGFIGGAIASRGNPLAAIRAARNANKNGNFQGVGEEYSRGRNRREALKSGATRRQIMADSMRRRLGLESSSAKQDYDIDSAKYDVTDENGKSGKLSALGIATYSDGTKRDLNKEKEANNTRIEELNQQVRKDNQIVADNEQAIQHRSTIKTEALDEIHKDTSDITRDISFDATDASGATRTMTLSGNYNALKDQIEKGIKDGTISGDAVTTARNELGKAEKSMWMQFVDDATTIDPTTGKYGINNHSNGKINTAYQQLIQSEAKKVFKKKTIDSDGNVTLEVLNSNSSARASERVEDLFSKANDANSEIKVAQGDLNREKTDLERANESIDSMFSQREKQISQAKQTDKYRSTKASSEYNDKNKPSSS